MKRRPACSVPARLRDHHSLSRCGWALVWVLAVAPVALGEVGEFGEFEETDTHPGPAREGHPPAFDEIYDLLQTHCGTCHVRGGADGPWSLDTPPDADQLPSCLELTESAALRCATYHQLTDTPGPDIPAWIQPDNAASSDLYVQACVPGASFHIGHSLPEGIPPADCARLLRWIESGAPY